MRRPSPRSPATDGRHRRATRPKARRTMPLHRPSRGRSCAASTPPPPPATAAQTPAPAPRPTTPPSRPRAPARDARAACPCPRPGPPAYCPRGSRAARSARSRAGPSTPSAPAGPPAKPRVRAGVATRPPVDDQHRNPARVSAFGPPQAVAVIGFEAPLSALCGLVHVRWPCLRLPCSSSGTRFAASSAPSGL